MNGQHTTQISSDMFYVWSLAADYEYIVRVENEKDLNKAMEIAESRATEWGSADAENPFFYMGYVEVVKEGLEEMEIEATYFTDCYE